MFNHTISSQLYYKYLQTLQRLDAKYAQSAKATELNLRNTARKTLDKKAMLALSPKPNMFVCWLGNYNNKESIRPQEKSKYYIESNIELQRQKTGRRSSNRINQFYELFNFQLLFYLSNEGITFACELLFLWKSSYSSIPKWFSSNDKRNRLSSHLNAWRESLSLKVIFFEIFILFQR